MSAASWRGAAVASAVAALAFWAGTRVARPSAPAPPERVVVERMVPIGSAGGLTRDDIRAVVREELAAHAGAPVAEPAALEPVALEPEAADAARSAVLAARAAVAAGVARGVWGDEERAALRAQLIHLGADQTREVLAPLFRAINAQELQLDGPPF